MMFLELEWTGQSSMTRFRGLSGGNTCKADTISSASGVPERMGLSIRGVLGSPGRSRLAGSPWNLPGSGVSLPVPQETQNGMRLTAGSHLGRMRKQVIGFLPSGVGDPVHTVTDIG